MGCSSSASKTWSVHRIEKPPDKQEQGCGGSASDSLAEALDEAMRREQEDLKSTMETSTVISRSTSVRSVVSGVTSLHSSSKYHVRTREDTHSEVPAISESVADMDDLQEWVEEGTATAVIDNRQHPLAPSNISMYSTESVTSTNTMVVGDLGGCSDVPSVRDDASVTSVPLDMCLGFRGSRAYSSRCGSKEDQQLHHSERSTKLGPLRHRPPPPDYGTASAVLPETEPYHEGRTTPPARQHPRLEPTRQAGARRWGGTLRQKEVPKMLQAESTAETK